MRSKLVGAFLIGGVVGFLLSQAAQSLIDAGAASKMKHSIGNGDQLAQALTPKYLREVPTDVHGRPFMITMNSSTPTVISVGRGGFVVQKRKLVECRPYTTEGCS